MSTMCVCVHTLSLCSYVITNTPFLPQVWINQGDIILVGLRDYQDNKADVILRYNPDEARNLKSYGELPDTGGCGHKEAWSLRNCMSSLIQLSLTI